MTWRQLEVSSTTIIALSVETREGSTICIGHSVHCRKGKWTELKNGVLQRPVLMHHETEAEPRRFAKVERGLYYKRGRTCR